jgi:hypothetical protein
VVFTFMLGHDVGWVPYAGISAMAGNFTFRCKTFAACRSTLGGDVAGAGERIYDLAIEALPEETERNKLGLTFGIPRQSPTPTGLARGAWTNRVS